MIGHSDFKAITPVTSVASFMQDASSANAALEIDTSIISLLLIPLPIKAIVASMTTSMRRAIN